MSVSITSSWILGLSLAAGSVAAQRPATAAPTPSPTTVWAAHPLGTYHLVADADGSPKDATLRITTDSTGKDMAVVALADGQSHKMTVTVNQPYLLLEAVDDNGVMRLKLERQGDSVSGIWTHNLNGGTVKGARTP